MISCTEFIPAYSELFKFLEARGGHEAAVGFWNYISDNFLGNLREMVEKHGLRGCWLYWSHTLNEEAADFAMELDEEAGTFTIAMHHCPSKGMLNGLGHMKAYHDYCGHCDALYGRVLEPLGYECSFDMSGIDEARCTLTVRRRATP
jgi:hypothetical protein